MTSKQLDILVNIIGGVESGGQQYGNRRYDAYAAPYANSPEEHTITLGWCQFYGNNGRKLCQRIFDADKTLFRKNDTANIEKRLNQDWVALRWNPSSAEKAALIKIVTTDVGKRIQDEMFKEDTLAFIKDAETFGISDIGAQIMYCEIRHLGGKGPVERIFNRAKKPYTADTVYASLLFDQNDKSNSNQVGDKKYQSRHEKCVEWIHKYIDETAFDNHLKNKNNMTYDKYINSSGTHYISNSGSDERGKYNSGNAGDSTGNEWNMRSWYNRPWDCVLRHPDEKVRMKLAELACAAALNDCIGYDQYQRDTYWLQLQKVNYDPSKITTKCESDCSAGVIANTKAVGYLLGISVLKNVNATYTGNMKAGYKAAGFIVLTESKYRNGTDYLLPGDILLNEKAHTATNITKGSKAVLSSTSSSLSTNSSTVFSNNKLNTTKLWQGKTTSKLNVRTWAGIEYGTCSFSPLKKGEIIDVLDTVKANDGVPWYYIMKNGKTGFVCAEYVKNVSETAQNAHTETKMDIAKTDTTLTFNPYMVKVTASELNIRSGSGIGHSVVGEIRDKGSYTIVDEQKADGYTWGLLKSYAKKRNGWIALEYTKRI